jgi:hypothetical protein
LFDKRWSEGYSDKTVKRFIKTNRNISVSWLIRRNDIWRPLLFFCRELLAYFNYLNHKDQSEYYLKRWKKYQPALIRPFLNIETINTLLSGRVIQSLLRYIEGIIPPDVGIVKHIKDYKPEVVIAGPANMRYSEEIEYIKAGKSLNIPTLIPVYSWDNLMTKGLFHVIPDLLVVWNSLQKKEAEEFQNIPSEKIIITGSPFFDKWFGNIKKFRIAKTYFYNKLGLEKNVKYVVYLGSSANIAYDETWIITNLAQEFKKSNDNNVKKMVILVRPHPANAKIYEKLNHSNVIVWPKEGILAGTDNSLSDFYNTLYYSIGTIGINTSAMIDAVILDKPCITFLTDEYEQTQIEALHFQYLYNYRVLYIVKSTKKCIDTVARLSEGFDSKKEIRHRFVREFIRPNGLAQSAGEIIAQAIERIYEHHRRIKNII